MNLPRLDRRLMCAAEAVGKCRVVADVGTDHAYLPVYLVLSGRAEYAIASDINEGPVMRATLNVTSYGLNSRIQVIRTDGLHGIEEYSPDAVLILGMGGELIVKIISEAPWLKAKGIRLVLQPMTHPEIVRSYLWDNGFEIVSELLAENGKIYNITVAEYRGDPIAYTELEALTGRLCDVGESPLLKPYLEHLLQIYSTRISGIKAGGGSAVRELEMYSSIDELLKSLPLNN